MTELVEIRRPNERRVDRKDDRQLVARNAQSGNDAGECSLRLGPVVDDVERQVRCVAALANRDPLGASDAECPPCAFGEGLAVEFRQSFRRAEAAARTADEQDPRQSSSRHGSL